MGQPPQTKEFKRLKQLWDKKLKQSGFEDIEYDEDHLKHYVSSGLSRRLNGATYEVKMQLDESTQEYYRLAGQWLFDHTFNGSRERLIWTLHSNGESFRDIAKQVKTKDYKANKDNINTLITKLAAEMLKFYRNRND